MLQPAPETRTASPILAVRRFYFGLDLGQAADYTAATIMERVTVEGKREPDFHVRHLERFPIGTSYPAVVEKVKTMLASAELVNCTLVVDQTGVGRPVVDMLRAQHLWPIAVTITGGNEVTRDGSGFRVPKRDLASTLQVLLQNKRLHVARALPQAALLTQELLNFRVKISTAGHDSYEAWREGVHDDLVLASALAAWYAVHYGAQALPVAMAGRGRPAY